MTGSIAATSTSRRTLTWIGLAALCAVTFVSFAPLIALVLSIATAQALGCPVDEGAVHPCVVAGIDIGASLYTGFVLGWAIFLTAPGMVVTLGIWALLLGRFWWRRARG